MKEDHPIRGLAWKKRNHWPINSEWEPSLQNVSFNPLTPFLIKTHFLKDLKKEVQANSVISLLHVQLDNKIRRVIIIYGVKNYMSYHCTLHCFSTMKKTMLLGRNYEWKNFLKSQINSFSNNFVSQVAKWNWAKICKSFGLLSFWNNCYICRIEVF